MKHLKLFVAFAALAVLVACATTGANYRPMIDTAGVDFNKYEADLAACQQYAQQVAGAAQTAAVGAVAGALFGAALAGLTGGGRYVRNTTSAVGALSGGVSGAAAGETDQRNVIRRCLVGRGYSVLQ